MSKRSLSIQSGIAAWLAKVSREHPTWKWGLFKRLSKYVRRDHRDDPLDGALPSSAACEFVGVCYIDVFHAARAEELLRGLIACLDRFRQLTPTHLPWEGRHALLAQFMRSVSRTSWSRYINLGLFEPVDPAMVHMGRCWITLFQPAPSLIVLSAFCVPDSSTRTAAAEVLQKPIEQQVEWRLAFRRRLQVLAMWSSVRGSRQEETRHVEQAFSEPIADLFRSLPSLLGSRLVVPCWWIRDPDHPLASSDASRTLETLLELMQGTWYSDWMTFGFAENLSREWYAAGDTSLPRLVIDREAFERSERVDMYADDVDMAIQDHLANRLPGLGAALAVRQLADELLPLGRRLHYRAYRATEYISRSADRIDPRELSTVLQRLLPRVAELRAVAGVALDRAGRDYGLDGFLRHPACPLNLEGSLLDAIRKDVFRNLSELRRVVLIGKELAEVTAADSVQRSANRTNLALGALTVVLTLLGIMSLCLQLGQPIGVATLVGVLSLLCIILLWRAVRLATTGWRRSGGE